MNLGEIRKAVVDLVDDDGYEDELNSIINTVYQQAVNEPEVRIPSLKGFTTITTVVGQNYVSMLTGTPNFSGKLLRFGSDKVKIFPSLESLFDRYQEDGTFPNKAGEIRGVALEGNVLWYQDVPATASTLAAIYYADPTALSVDTDIPSALPAMCHLEVLVYGTARWISDKQEDGMEGPKNNTLQFERIYNRGISRVLTWLGSRKTANRTSVWDH